LGTLAYDFAFVVEQWSFSFEHKRLFAQQHFAVGIFASYFGRFASLVADVTVLVDSIRPDYRVGIVRSEPYAQPVESQPAASKLDGAPAQVVD
jgi:hypothetical protein